MRCQCGAEFYAVADNCPECGAPAHQATVGDKESGKERSKESSKTGGFPAGMVVFEKYEIVRLLGRGGMGQVYLARDLQLERQIALKTLSKELSNDQEHKSRFMREARMASSLNHPNILTVFEIGAV